jgi:DNA-directed RNA polymerase subunit RPC12/RpoP
MAESTWTCPNCQQLVQVDVDRSIPLTVQCAGCDGWIEIPAEDQAESIPPLIGQSPTSSRGVYPCPECGKDFYFPGYQGVDLVTCPHCGENVPIESLDGSTVEAPPRIQIPPFLPSVVDLTEAMADFEPLAPDRDVPSSSAPPSAAPEPTGPQVVFETPEEKVELSEPTAVAQVGSAVRPLRRLTRNEKSQRRMIRNLALWLLGSIALIVFALWRM